MKSGLVISAAAVAILLAMVGWFVSRAATETNRRFEAEFATRRFFSLNVENPCDYPLPESIPLTDEEVVYAAECIVRENGYTDVPPVSDRTKILAEPVWGMPNEETLAQRRNTLEPRAVGLEFPEPDADDSGWYQIYFRIKAKPEYTQEQLESLDKWGWVLSLSADRRYRRAPHLVRPIDSPDLRIVDK